MKIILEIGKIVLRQVYNSNDYYRSIGIFYFNLLYGNRRSR